MDGLDKLKERIDQVIDAFIKEKKEEGLALEKEDQNNESIKTENMDTIKIGEATNSSAPDAAKPDTGEEKPSKRVITITIDGTATSMKDEIDGKLELQLDWPEIPQRIRTFMEVNDNEIKTQKSK